MLYRADEERCAEGVVDDERNVVLVGNGCHCLKVGDIRVGVAEGLGIYHLGVGLYGCLQGFEVVHVDDGVGDALCGERVGYEVERASIEVVGSNDVVASLNDVLKSVGHGGGTRSNGQTCYTSLKGCNAVFKHTLCRVGQTTVDVAGVAQAEAVGSVL